jgi:NAD(P)-dependent dehydrogenase (short-subunit alcohol dehydrogenase family)
MTTAIPHAVITGASSGIGAAVATRLLDSGWRVTGIDRQPPPERLAPRIVYLAADLTDPAAVDALPLPVGCEEVTAFVHCAGIMRADDDPATRADLATLLWRVHVGVAEALVRRLIPALADNAGRIVLISSRGAQGRAGRALYAASKAALDGLSRSFALELLTRGITSNVIAPGSTATPMLHDPARANAPIMKLPIGRLVQPEEIAALVAFLVSPDAGAITGQTVFICGGASLVGA